MSFDDILKTGLVFLHFMASAVALATILRADFLILMHYTSKLSTKACDRIHGAKSVVSGALWVLWLSGIAICAHGFFHDPAYLMNQKLWMKVMVVLVLSANGWFLHSFAFRFIRPGVRLSDAQPHHRAVLTLMACLSSTSWLFASFLGIARALNYKDNFTNLMSLYLLLLGVNLVASLLLTHLLGYWHRRGAALTPRRVTRVLRALRHKADAGQESEMHV